MGEMKIEDFGWALELSDEERSARAWQLIGWLKEGFREGKDGSSYEEELWSRWLEEIWAADEHYRARLLSGLDDDDGDEELGGG